MREFKKLTSFPGEDRIALKTASEKTGLNVNQIIVRCVHDSLPKIVAESAKVDLSPIPDSAIAKALAEMSRAEIEADNALGRASVEAQKRKR